MAVKNTADISKILLLSEIANKVMKTDRGMFNCFKVG